MENEKLNPALFEPGKEYKFDATPISIDYEGNVAANAPIKATFVIESTGDSIQLATCDRLMLKEFEYLIEKKKICHVVIMCVTFKDSKSFNLKMLEKTENTSAVIKINPVTDTSGYKNLIATYVAQVKNKNYSSILNIVLNDSFYKWRAAKSIHHAYEGGLAQHSYNVCVNALKMFDIYNNNNGIKIDKDLLITGALLHDIGKLEEYMEDGNYSFTGQLLSHIILGIEIIDEACGLLNIDKRSNDILKLKHIIASHHGEYEFGSPNTPCITEAYIVSQADLTDSKLEIVTSQLAMLNDGDVSKGIFGLDNKKVFKI